MLVAGNDGPSGVTFVNVGVKFVYQSQWSFGDTCCHAVSRSALAFCSGERKIDVDGSANLGCSPITLLRIERIGARMQFGEP